MPRSQQKKTKLWYQVDWLPDYVVHKHKKGSSAIQSLVLTSKLEANKGKKDDEKLDFPILKTTRFTLFKMSDFNRLLESGVDKQDFYLVEGQSFSEKTQAKFVYDLLAKKNIRNKKIFLAIESIKQSPNFQEKARILLQQYKDETLFPKKKEKSVFSSRLVSKPFHYFGNSINYLENIDKILAASDSFLQAQLVKDVTCGSCTLTFYLAEKYPNKKYIASDINSEVINMLHYIQQTPISLIEKEYEAYHAMLFNLDPIQWKKKYQELIDFFNQSNPKNYCLLIFLQNNSYTNISFKEDGTIKANMKLSKPPQANFWLDCIRKCKGILAKSDIVFKQLDMNEAIAGAKEGDFCFMTPPHENDQKNLYLSYIRKDKLVTALNQLNKNQVPYLITYGDNTTKAASDLGNEVELYRFSYVVPGGIQKNPKKLSIYISPTVVRNKDRLSTLQNNFLSLAKKTVKKAIKNLEELDKLKTLKHDPMILKSAQFESDTQQLAEEILSEKTGENRDQIVQVGLIERKYMEKGVFPDLPLNLNGLIQNSIFAMPTMAVIKPPVGSYNFRKRKNEM